MVFGRRILLVDRISLLIGPDCRFSCPLFAVANLVSYTMSETLGRGRRVKAKSEILLLFLQAQSVLDLKWLYEKYCEKKKFNFSSKS